MTSAQRRAARAIGHKATPTGFDPWASSTTRADREALRADDDMRLRFAAYYAPDLLSAFDVAGFDDDERARFVLNVAAMRGQSRARSPEHGRKRLYEALKLARAQVKNERAN